MDLLSVLGRRGDHLGGRRKVLLSLSSPTFPLILSGVIEDFVCFDGDDNS